MKKRRTLIISLLLVAALCLGVGYAAITGELVVQGKVAAKAQPFNVHFIKFDAAAGTAHSVLSNTPAISCDTVLSDTAPAKSIMLNVRDMSTGATDASGGDRDYVSAVLTIRNDNDSKMYLDVAAIQYGSSLSTVTDTPSEYFKVTVDWKNGVKSLDPGATTDITVTVTMLKSCETEFAEYFQITVSGTSQAPSTTTP